MNTKEIFASLIKEGATEVKNLTVKNVNVTPKDSWVMVSLTLDQEIDGYVSNDGVTYEPGKTNVVFVSIIPIIAQLKENPNAAFAANHLMQYPNALSLVLSHAKVDLVQEKVASGEVYKNPFSSKESEKTFDHDAIINHVRNITLSEFGLKALDKIANAMLGIIQ